MEKQKQELEAVSLSELRNKLSAADYELFRRTVVLRCMITNATWSNWTNGKCTPETKYQPIINEIASPFGLSIFETEGGQP